MTGSSESLHVNHCFTRTDADSPRALTLAAEAHGLAPDLVPAAAIAGRLLAAQGATPRAARILLKTWKRAPHPDLATAYAFARIGDSPRDRLARARELAQLTPHDDEGAFIVATAAIDAQDWPAARRALAHLVEASPTQRVCTLMARIEGGEHGNAGKVREWLARAVSAPRDPAWIADGRVSARWMPVSPVTGELDACVWQAPGDSLERRNTDVLLEQLVRAGEPLGPGGERLIEARRIEAEDATVMSTGAVASPTKPAAARPQAERPTTTSATTARPSEPARSTPTIVRPAAGSVPSVGPAATGTPATPKSTPAPVAGATNQPVTNPASASTPTKPPSSGRSVVTPLGLPARPGNGQATGQPNGQGKPAPETKASASETTEGATGTAGGSSTTTPPNGASGSISAPDGKDAKDGKSATDPEPERAAGKGSLPHAPDDPGPDAGEAGDTPAPMTRFRVPPRQGGQ